MKYTQDGDQMCITKDNFVNLQESEAVFIPWDSPEADIIRKDGFTGLPFGDLKILAERLGL